MGKERKILRFVPQKLRKSFANGNPTLGVILLAINIKRKPATISAKSKGTILNLLNKTGNHTNTICDLSTPLPQGAISLAINIKRKLPTFNAKSTEQLLSGSKQYGVSISTNVFEVYMLQVQVNRRNYNSYVVIYRMINTIMLGITAQLK